MIRNDVESHHFKSVGYDPVTQTMEIEFHNGSIYRGRVPADHHEAMMASDSIGTYYHANIKNKFELKRVK